MSSNSEIYARIVGTGSAVPDQVLTNEDLEKLVDTSDQWIRERTGISERRVADESTASSDLAIEAGRKALESAGIKPEELDLILVATVSPDMFFPSTGCLVQRALTREPIAAYDLSAACSGYIYALSAANAYIKSGMATKILVIGVDTLCKFVNWSDRNSCVLFGDGAGATVVVADKTPGVLRVDMASDGTYGELLIIPGGGSRRPCSEEVLKNDLQYIDIQGREVFKTAVRLMTKSVQNLLQECNLTVEDVDVLIPHQANLRIIEAVVKRVKVPIAKTLINVDRFGNTAAATIPIALDEAVRDGRVKRDDLIVMVSFGGGFTWGSAALHF